MSFAPEMHYRWYTLTSEQWYFEKRGWMDIFENVQILFKKFICYALQLKELKKLWWSELL